jgi:prepilin-type N-terminal cleavage/methylation domain-containing protein
MNVTPLALVSLRESPMSRSRPAFTLIELLIVIVIIGILAMIAIPKFANSKQKAYISAMRSDLKNLITAEEAFYADSGFYTAALDTSYVKARRKKGMIVSGTGLLFEPSPGVTVPLITPGQGYWSATVTHDQISNPVMTCGIGVNTVNPVVPAAGEGEPACQ